MAEWRITANFIVGVLPLGAKAPNYPSAICEADSHNNQNVNQFIPWERQYLYAALP